MVQGSVVLAEGSVWDASRRRCWVVECRIRDETPKRRSLGWALSVLPTGTSADLLPVFRRRTWRVAEFRQPKRWSAGVLGGQNAELPEISTLASQRPGVHLGEIAGKVTEDATIARGELKFRVHTPCGFGVVRVPAGKLPAFILDSSQAATRDVPGRRRRL